MGGSRKLTVRLRSVMTLSSVSGSLTGRRSADPMDVVNALNALGVSPRDLIAIFQAIKAAGALQAELEVI